MSEKLKLKLERIGNGVLVPALTKLCNLNIHSGRDTYALMRTLEKLNPEIEAFRKTKESLLKKHGGESNLTALRELALRCTARRVDDQMLSYMRSHAIPGPWAAGERVLVCIDERPLGAVLVRTGKRIADRLRAKWAVLHVETGHDAGLSDADHDRIADTLRLAERLLGHAHKSEPSVYLIK